ncbi:MAG: MBL fold metallo-hydrolase [Anaerolineales bacterium]|nr:MBL fold metallo-hydrolase [Anaerolineales bacterium]
MNAHESYESDIISTSAGDLKITFLGHGSLLMVFNGEMIYVDPYSKVADYSLLPKADLILLTHEHGDHLDPQALACVRMKDTQIVLTAACARQVQGGIVLGNGQSHTVLGLHIEAVPAYNLLHKRPNGQPFHPKGEGNGYILTFGDLRLYIAGDTENIPEMSKLENIAVAFLPMNLPYTMTPEMVAEAARLFQPKILYPYHYGDTDPGKLVELLKKEPIEVRIRKLA